MGKLCDINETGYKYKLEYCTGDKLHIRLNVYCTITFHNDIIYNTNMLDIGIGYIELNRKVTSEEFRDCDLVVSKYTENPTIIMKDFQEYLETKFNIKSNILPDRPEK